MSYNNPGEVLTDIANSIRTLNASTSSIPFVDMPELIKGAISEPIDLSDYNGTSWVLPFMEHVNFTGITSVTSMFSYIDCDVQIPTHSLNLRNFSINGINSLLGLFESSKLIDILGIENLNTSNITNITRMFHGTYISGSLDLSNWNVSSATYSTTSTGDSTFAECNITNLNLTGWDLSSCNSLMYLFYRSNVQNLNLSNWTIPSGSLMQMFDGATIGSLDLTGWDTSQVTSMISMFDGARITKMWVPSTFVYTGNPSYGNPFAEASHLVIYTDASSASEQGWGTLPSSLIVKVYYNSTYQDFINA